MSAAALIIAGGVAKAAGIIQEGRIAKAQGSFEKKIALRNQQELERQADAEIAASKIESARISRRGKIAEAAQIAAVGKLGVGLAGSTLSVLADTAAQFFIERNLVLRSGLFRARSLRQRGSIIAAQGRFAKTLGTQAQRLSFAKAGGSILSSAGSSGAFKGGGQTQSFSTSQTRFGTSSNISRGGFGRNF